MTKESKAATSAKKIDYMEILRAASGSTHHSLRKELAMSITVLGAYSSFDASLQIYTP